MSVQYKDENGILQKGAGLYKSEVPIGIADIYTEGERQIGLWIDGKPLYQRTFDLGSDVSITNNAFTNTTIDASSMETLVDAKAIYSTGVTRYNVMANISNGVIRLQADRNDTGINARYIVLQYTKTADSSTGVLPKSASALYLLGDVEISNLQNGDVLKFDDDDNKWKNGVGGGGGNANIWTGTQAELEEVFDELEEGTQINITDDEQEVVEGGTIYSEEEQVIGLWTDNKPIYQKTWTGLSVTPAYNTWTNIISNDDNIEKIVKWSALSGNDYKNIDGSGLEIQVTSSNVRAEYNQNANVREINILTLQYTKSTDAPLDAVVGKKTMYIASSDCYSTEEKEVGCWHNGKPIYQKCVDFGALPNATSKTVAHGIENIEDVVDARLFATDANHANFLPLNFTATSSQNLPYQVSGYITSTNIRIDTGSNRTGMSGYVVIQYTKTTDTAGSGQYTPASGKAVHYSTNEQVVGTWINGEPVYEICATTSIPATNVWSSAVLTNLNINILIDATLISNFNTNSDIIVNANDIQSINGGIRVQGTARAVDGVILRYTKATS